MEVFKSNVRSTLVMLSGIRDGELDVFALFESFEAPGALFISAILGF